MAVTITYDSIPDHDDWLWDNFWDCNEWVLYNKALREKHGIEEGDRIWVKAYDESSYGAAEINCATKNTAFKEYMLATGLSKKSSILSKVYRAENSVNAVLQPFSDLYQGAADALTGTGNLLGGAGKSISVFGKLIPVMTILIALMLTAGIGLLIYGIARNPGAAIGTAIKYAK